MAEIETCPPRYNEYLASQRRVSNWVQKTHSQTTHQSLQNMNRPLSSKRSPSTESILTNSSPPRHRHSAQKKSHRRLIRSEINNGKSIGQQPLVSPTVALISSSLFVYAFLPSLLTITAFVVILTLATMETEETKDRKSKVCPERDDALLS
ncbi:hypothetical protein CVT25_002184 [Psilocybe cyanescens]|uniref:Uncharacterized protein n=1 Tax=Psilocybe cyanescens TaxID=93625 RepID=A0A409XF49_PSICY|nr:hypothetical protein CVT25_002184 [Psilocybe cyanescens]